MILITEGESADLALASRAFELFQDFEKSVQNSFPDFLEDEYYAKLESKVSTTIIII